MADDKPTTAELISQMKFQLPIVLAVMPQDIKDEVIGWPDAAEIEGLDETNVQSFFDTYFDDEHKAAVNKAASQANQLTRPTLTEAATYFNNIQQGQKVSDLVSDPEVLTAAKPEPSVTPGQSKKVSHTLPKAKEAAHDGEYSHDDISSIQHSAPGSGGGSTHRYKPSTPSGNPPKPKRAGAGGGSGGSHDDGEDDMFDNLMKKFEKHPVLGGMAVGLAMVGVKAMTGKVEFGDIFTFMIIGALAGFVGDKFLNGTSHERGYRPNELCMQHPEGRNYHYDPRQPGGIGGRPPAEPRFLGPNGFH